MKSPHKTLLNEYKKIIILDSVKSGGILSDVVESPVSQNKYWSEMGGQTVVGFKNMNVFSEVIKDAETEWKSIKNNYRFAWIKSVYNTRNLNKYELSNTNLSKLISNVIVIKQENIILNNIHKINKTETKNRLKNISTYISWNNIK